MNFFHWLPFIGICCVSFSCTAISEQNNQAPAVKEMVQKETQLRPQPQQKKLPTKGEVTEVLVEQVFALRGEGQALLIDTRPPLFFALGHIDGAINVPLKHYEKSYPANKSTIAAAKSEGKVLIVYCANEVCVDSHKMANQLAIEGFDSSVFKGGWELWKETGLE